MFVDAVSVIDVVPEVAVACREVALVDEMVAPPVPVASTSEPVPTTVAAVWEIAPSPLAVSVVVPETFVVPMVMPPFEPAVAVRLSAPAVIKPVVLSVPPAAESVTLNVPLTRLDDCTVVDAVSVMEVVPEVADALSAVALVLDIVAPPLLELSDRVPVLTVVPPDWEILPVPSAVSAVVPDTFVLPMVTLPLEPGVAVKFRAPPVSVPEAVIDPPFAELLTLNVPEPTLDVCSAVDTVSVTEVVPDVAVALMKTAFVLEMVAPPVDVTSDKVLVPTLVAAVCEIEPEPLAVSVVVPDTFVVPICMLPLEPTVVDRLSVPAVMIPAVASVPPEAESLTVRVPLARLDACTVVDAVSTIETSPEVAVALIDDALVLVIEAPPVPVIKDNVPVLMTVAGVCEIEPVPVAVSAVVPDTVVFPIVEMLEFEPLLSNVKFPAVIVPAVEMVALLAVSVTDSVPELRLELVIVMAELLSTTAVVPEVAAAFNEPAVVELIVAPPVPVVSDNVPAVIVPEDCPMVPAPPV